MKVKSQQDRQASNQLLLLIAHTYTFAKLWKQVNIQIGKSTGNAKRCKSSAGRPLHFTGHLSHKSVYVVGLVYLS